MPHSHLLPTPTSQFIPHGSHPFHHTSWLMSHCSCIIVHAEVPLVLDAHTAALIPHAPYLINHTSWLMSHCSCIIVHAGFPFFLDAHTAALIPHVPYLMGPSQGGRKEPPKRSRPRARTVRARGVFFVEPLFLGLFFVLGFGPDVART